MMNIHARAPSSAVIIMNPNWLDNSLLYILKTNVKNQEFKTFDTQIRIGKDAKIVRNCAAFVRDSGLLG